MFRMVKWSAFLISSLLSVATFAVTIPAAPKAPAMPAAFKQQPNMNPPANFMQPSKQATQAKTYSAPSAWVIAFAPQPTSTVQQQIATLEKKGMKVFSQPSGDNQAILMVGPDVSQQFLQEQAKKLATLVNANQPQIKAFDPCIPCNQQ